MDEKNILDDHFVVHAQHEGKARKRFMVSPLIDAFFRRSP